MFNRLESPRPPKRQNERPSFKQLCNVNTGGSNLRPLIIIGEISYVTESLARVFGDELLCPVHLFDSMESWRRSPYTQCAAFIVVDAPAPSALSNCHEIVSQLKRLGDDSPIIVISDVDSPVNVAKSFACGARGYIPTSATLDEALAAIRRVLSGGVFAPAGIVPPDQRQGNGDS